MYNLITTNQIYRKQDIISVKSDLPFDILYVDLERTVTLITGEC